MIRNKKCRVCDSNRLELALDLGMQPWCNHFLEKKELGKEPHYPLRLIYCHDCSTSQLDFTVKKEIMFGDHTYLSGITKSLSEHFEKIAIEADQNLLNDQSIHKSILDIGSNDGTQLKHFQKLGYEVLGVESSIKTAKLANDAGVPTLNAFFNLETMQKIGKQFDLMNAAGVFFHLEELHSVCEAIKFGLKKKGVFIVQFLYMKSIMENVAFDQIYHEHLLYYTLKTIQNLLNRHDLSLFDTYLAPIHGGSVIAYVGHKGEYEKTARLHEMIKVEDQSQCNTFEAYKKFACEVQEMKQENLSFLHQCQKTKKRVFGFGAPVKGNTLLNYFGIGTDLIECLVEKNELRKNLYSPGMHIPLRIESELGEDLPDVYYVLAWNFKDEILKNNQHLLKKGIQFYFPVNPKEIN